MLRVKLLALAGLMLAAPATLQAQAEGASQMSEASQGIVRDQIAARNAKIEPLMKRKQELDKEFAVLMTPEGYDEAKLASTMTEIRTVEGEIVELRAVALQQLLKSLPDADRNLFLKSLTRTPPEGDGR